MARYHFTTNGHEIDIKLADDGLEILHDGQAVTDIDNSSHLNEGGFRVFEDGEEATYKWKVEFKSSWISPTAVHTIQRNGEVVLEVEVEAP